MYLLPSNYISCAHYERNDTALEDIINSTFYWEITKVEVNKPSRQVLIRVYRRISRAHIIIPTSSRTFRDEYLTVQLITRNAQLLAKASGYMPYCGLVMA